MDTEATHKEDGYRTSARLRPGVARHRSAIRSQPFDDRKGSLPVTETARPNGQGNRCVARSVSATEGKGEVVMSSQTILQQFLEQYEEEHNRKLSNQDVASSETEADHALQWRADKSTG